MRWLFPLFIFFSVISHSQSFDVRLDKAVHDYGYIKEADGKIYSEVEFKNYSPFPVSVFKVISSCGCAVAEADDGWIKPGAKGKIKFSYDPTGRPGKFVKSFEIQFVSDSLKKSVYFNIKGYTIEKELLDTYIDNLYEGTQLMIKPFSAEMINATDYRFLDGIDWTHFINDITYEIDQNSFSNITIQVYTSSEEGCNKIQNLYSVIHKNIISELEKRKYESWSAGFTDIPCQIKSGLDASMIHFKVSSKQYNNDTIRESGFFFTGKEIELNQFSLYGKRDSIQFKKNILSQIVFSDIKFLKEEENKEYSSFLNLLNRKILVNQKSDVMISAKVACRPSDRSKVEVKILEQIKKIQAKVSADAEESGADLNKIFYAVPEIDFKIDSAYKPGKFRIYPWKLNLLSPVLNEINESNAFAKFISNDSIKEKKLENFLLQTGFKSPYQNLPVYETEHTGVLQFDSKNIIFRKWFEIIKSEAKNGVKIKFLIESSVGRTPLKKDSELQFQSRKNAQKMLSEINKIATELGFNDTLFEIEIISSNVQGAISVSKESEVSFNSDFNYLKIIPVYSLGKSEIKKIPYQINFNNNAFEMPVNTVVFQNFIDRIVSDIDQNGFSTLIIESSSSKIPSTIYNDNKILSFYRAEDAEIKIRKEIQKRGYDATRLVVSEKRTLVQGPEFKSEADRKKYKYDDYQYVKIIPQSLIKD